VYRAIVARQAGVWTELKEMMDSGASDPYVRAVANEISVIYRSLGTLAEEVARMERELKELRAAAKPEA
jgi:hypothetical protein